MPDDAAPDDVAGEAHPLPPPLAPPADRRPAGRRRLYTLVGLFGALVVVSNIGTILSATLVSDAPGLLLALSSRIRHLLLGVAAGINPVVYVAVGGLRIAAAAVVTYLLGHGYGVAALDWVERQTQGELPATFRWVERGVDRFGGWLLVLMPGSNVVCALVGARGMVPRRFGALLAIGIALRLGSIWVLGKAFEEPLDKLLDWIERYQWWLVVGFFVLTVASSLRRANRVEPPRDRET